MQLDKLRKITVMFENEVNLQQGIFHFLSVLRCMLLNTMKEKGEKEQSVPGSDFPKCQKNEGKFNKKLDFHFF